MVGGKWMAKINVLLGICCRELRKPIPNLYSGGLQLVFETRTSEI
jgi:hypothetical protein